MCLWVSIWSLHIIICLTWILRLLWLLMMSSFDETPAPKGAPTPQTSLLGDPSLSFIPYISIAVPLGGIAATKDPSSYASIDVNKDRVCVEGQPAHLTLCEVAVHFKTWALRIFLLNGLLRMDLDALPGFEKSKHCWETHKVCLDSMCYRRSRAYPCREAL